MSSKTKRLNKEAYLTILDDIRMPVFNIRDRINRMGFMSDDMLDDFKILEEVLQSLAKWDITEDVDCWGDHIPRVDTSKLEIFDVEDNQPEISEEKNND
jgi:hypothetical protein